jgi:CTP:phosphocholine cytidylyltransferase-like protein
MIVISGKTNVITTIAVIGPRHYCCLQSSLFTLKICQLHNLIVAAGGKDKANIRNFWEPLSIKNEADIPAWHQSHYSNTLFTIQALSSFSLCLHW